MAKYFFSPTKLNLFNDCKLCFWLMYKKDIHRPRGIFPSLPGGMDNVIKDYYDKFRVQGKLPPEIDGQVKGKLVPDMELMKEWRNWKKGLQHVDEKKDFKLVGALDDCLVDGKFYIPLDYKTRGYEPKEGDSERYYGNQLNLYAYLLKVNGYPVRDFGYLVYYYPKSVRQKGVVQFEVETVKIKASAKEGQKTIEAAVKLLNGPEPKEHSACEYCSWGDQIREEFD